MQEGFLGFWDSESGLFVTSDMGGLGGRAGKESERIVLGRERERINNKSGRNRSKRGNRTWCMVQRGD